MATLLPSVFVYADTSQRITELLAVGRQWAERVHLLFIGNEEQVHDYLHCGADVIHRFTPQEGIIIEDYVLSFAKTIQDADSRGFVLLPSSKRGKAIAARLGGRLNAAVLNDASEIQVAEDLLVASHPFYGGLAHTRVQLRSPWSVITLGAGNMVEERPPTAVAATLQDANFVTPVHPIKFVSRKEKPVSQVFLAKVKCVVGVGRGFGKQEDISLAQALAEVIHGEVGCSRPIAEGEGWMEQERYIGVSGVSLSADMYIAAGISGQIQHMVGVNQVKTIVAINKDKNAPIFSVADYGIVGDIYKILPELTKKLAN